MSEVIADEWDQRKTTAANMAHLGLQHDVNTLPDDLHMPKRKKRSRSGASDERPVVQLYDVPAGDMGKDHHNLRARPLSDDKQEFAARVLAKHGDDFEAAARDHKVNKMQLTASKLRKLCAKFIMLDEDDRVVDCPKFTTSDGKSVGGK